MDVKMLTGMAGANFSYRPGDVVAVPDDVGRAWIADGLAQANAPAAPIPHGRRPAPVKGKAGKTPAEGKTGGKVETPGEGKTGAAVKPADPGTVGNPADPPAPPESPDAGAAA